MTDAPLSEAGIAKAQSLADAYGMYSDERGLLSGYLSHALADVRRLRAALPKLVDIAHHAWHALDDCEDRGEEGALIGKYDFDKLHEALTAFLESGDIHEALEDLRAALGMKENEHG